MRYLSFQFYPGDWLRDGVAGCSLAAQGLWLRMLLIMHDAEDYGYLAVRGKPLPDEAIARRCGCSVEEYRLLLAELEAAGVPSRTPEGVIFFRRLVRDATNREAAVERQRKHRHASVTPMSHRASPSSSSSDPTPLTGRATSAAENAPQPTTPNAEESGKKNCTAPLEYAGDWLKVTPSMHERLVKSFPEFTEAEIRAEYRKAELWQQANLPRPRRNQLRAMRNWLAIELESGASSKNYRRASTRHGSWIFRQPSSNR